MRIAPRALLCGIAFRSRRSPPNIEELRKLCAGRRQSVTGHGNGRAGGDHVSGPDARAITVEAWDIAESIGDRR
jgi:hypothetical protein